MRIWKHIFLFLLLVLAVIIIAIIQLPDSNLHIIACNVGQGDAILVTYKTMQILTDGGPDAKVLDCLGRYMPFYDREIELVISTHPDSDHSTGLVEVMDRYKVDKLLINSIDPGTDIYRLLRKEVGGKGISVINPVEGMKLRLGLIYLDILSPSEDLFSKLTIIDSDDNLSRYSISKETNLYSIVYKLSFGKFTGLLLGDIPPEVSDTLANKLALDGVEWIKIPHHGSRNGLTENLLNKVMPGIAVISVGKNNWGLPSQEVLDLLAKYNVKVFRTDKVGDIVVVSDGERVWMKN